MTTKGMPLTGYVNSRTLKREVYYPSSIAADLLYGLEFFQHVVWYSEVVEKIRWEMDDGSFHTYTPDYIIHLIDGIKIIVECKPEDKVDAEHTLQQRAIGAAWALQNDHSFILITETELRAGFLLKNLIYLYRYAHLHLSIPKLERILNRLRAMGGKATIRELSEQSKGENEGNLDCVPLIINCIFNHLINTDLNQKISNDSLIWLPSEGDQILPYTFV
jgi:hypothetical protein